MTFRELKLPKELSKKKRMVLYKCYLVDKGKRGVDIPSFEMNSSKDLFALTPEKAYEIAINAPGLSIYEGKDVLTVLRTQIAVMLKLTLPASVMEEDILILNNESVDPGYNQEMGTLYVSTHGRIIAYEINNYELGPMEASDIVYDSDIGRLIVNSANFIEIIPA